MHVHVQQLQPQVVERLGEQRECRVVVRPPAGDRPRRRIDDPVVGIVIGADDAERNAAVLTNGSEVQVHADHVVLADSGGESFLLAAVRSGVALSVPYGRGDTVRADLDVANGRIAILNGRASDSSVSVYELP